MRRLKSILQITGSAILLAALSFPQTAFATAAVGQGEPQPAIAESATVAKAQTVYQEYVSRQYGIHLSGKVTRAQFADALEKVAGALGDEAAGKAATESQLLKSAGSSQLPVWEAVSAAVKAAEQEELADTYSEAKVAKTWAKAGLKYGQSGEIPLAAAQKLAVAIDLQIVSPEQLAGKADGRLGADLAYQLLGKVAEFHGAHQNYLGLISDADIYGKLVQAWNELQIIQAGELQQLADAVLQQNLITGYNLKDTAYDPHFDPARAITYGHSDIVHALQLIGLLKSEGIEAKVQLEPKTSVYLYLKEWGEPVQTENFRVEQIDDDRYIAYAKEYDLSLEFATAEEKARFQPLVLQYAKKNEEDAKGLLKGSWWQPLYYSLTKLDDYPVITNNYLQQGRFLVQTFSLNEDSPAVVAAFRKIDDSLEVSTYTFWVDQPFYNYLQGEYK